MRWDIARASTCGTAAGRSAANTTRRCSPSCATGAMPERKRALSRKPSSGRLARGKPQVEIGIATSGFRPAEVAGHAGALNGAPALRLRARRQRALHSRNQRCALWPVEQEAGLTICDGVEKPPRRVRYRRRAVSLAVHLVLPARFEERRHEEHVRARLDEVRELLVEARRHRHLAWIACGESGK